MMICRYVFNDFLVEKQDVREVFNFRNGWRTVCVGVT